MTTQYRISGLMQAWISGDNEKVRELLDLAIRLNSHTGIYLGRRRVMAWLQFEREVFTPYGITIVNTTTSDGLKTAQCEWRVGSCLHFIDTFTLNNSLLVTGIHRERQPLYYRNEADRKQTKEILKSLLGPKLSQHDPSMYPVLDFTHYDISNPMDLVKLPPRGTSGKRISLQKLTEHYAVYMLTASNAQSAAEKQANDVKEDRLVIKAKKQRRRASCVSIRQGRNASYPYRRRRKGCHFGSRGSQCGRR
eukprot:PhF_6_TR22522/c0_g2_i2/m.31972